jgi:hypothetical protein
MNIHTKLRFGVALLCLASYLSVPVSADTELHLVHVIQFHDYEIGSIDDWLMDKGFRFEQDAKRRDRLDFDIKDSALVIEANRQSLGLLPNEAVNLPDFNYIEIDWGVHKHPQGASYEAGVRNEALMTIVFMGDEKQPSGSMFIPNSPFFIGLFLCSGDDKLNHPYVGQYFTKSGRYVCTDRPALGELVTSRFNLMAAYRAYFDKENEDDPGISGLALALDTKKARDGRSSAFIREIRFFK